MDIVFKSPGKLSESFASARVHVDPFRLIITKSLTKTNAFTGSKQTTSLIQIHLASTQALSVRIYCFISRYQQRNKNCAPAHSPAPFTRKLLNWHVQQRGLYALALCSCYARRQTHTCSQSESNATGT